MKAVQFVSIPEQAAFKVRGAAKYLGISQNTLRKWSDVGLIPARRDLNGDRVYLLQDLDAYLNSLPPYKNHVKRLSYRSTKTGRIKEGGNI